MKHIIISTIFASGVASCTVLLLNRMSAQAALIGVLSLLCLMIIGVQAEGEA